MLGSRDSEVAMIIKDEEFETHKMNNVDYESGKFSGSLRRLLMGEHLGIFKVNANGNSNNNNSDSSSPNESFNEVTVQIDKVDDPVSDEFWNHIWNATARNNTEIYEEVFPVLPSDEVRMLSQIPDYMAKDKLHRTDPSLARLKLEQIDGHLVNLPLHFLIDETVLSNNYNAHDHLIPQIVYTWFGFFVAVVT